MIGSLIAALATGEAVNALRRAKSLVIAYLIAGVFGVVGIGFLLAAAYIRVERELGPLYTSLIFGGVFIAVAIIVLVWQNLSSKRTEKRVARRNNADVKKVAVAAGMTAFTDFVA